MNAHLQQFESAQRKGIALLRSLISDLHTGDSRADLDIKAKQRALEMGFDGWLTPPLINIQTPNNQASEGALIHIQLQPTTSNAFASVGCSLIHGAPETPLLAMAREICLATCTFANQSKCVGELFVFAQSWANNNCGALENNKNIGHACFGASGKLALGWPRSMRLMTKLRRHQVQWYNPRRMEGIFAIHPVFEKEGQSAGFSEMIVVDGSTRRVLGRDSMDSIGLWSK